MKYSFTSRIRYSEIGEDGNLTLPGLINYFQDCSTFQSEAIGEGVAELKKRGCAWVLSAWQIHVHRYPSLGEAVKITTWASGFKGFLGMRNFTMETEDGEMLACANSICLTSIWKRVIPSAHRKRRQTPMALTIRSTRISESAK